MKIAGKPQDNGFDYTNIETEAEPQMQESTQDLVMLYDAEEDRQNTMSDEDKRRLQREITAVLPKIDTTEDAADGTVIASSSHDGTQDNNETEAFDNRVSSKKKGGNAPVIVAVTIFIILAIALACAGVFYFFILNKPVATTNGLAMAGMKGEPTESIAIPDTLPEDFNIMLLGADEDSDRSGSAEFGNTFRSDTIILAHVNTKEGKLALCSFPRDLRVEELDDHGGPYKINAAYALGGVPLMKETLENFTGFDIQYYAVINMDGLESIIDSVGGVDLDIPYPVDDENVEMKIDAGKQHLSGKEALSYCRSRHTYDDLNAAGDIYRAGAQRQVIMAIVDAAKKADTGTLINLGNDLMRNMSTNLTVMQCAELAQKIGKSNAKDADGNTIPLEDRMVSMSIPTTSEYTNGQWFENAIEYLMPSILRSYNNFEAPVVSYKIIKVDLDGDGVAETSKATVVGANGKEIEDSDGDGIPDDFDADYKAAANKE